MWISWPSHRRCTTGRQSMTSRTMRTWGGLSKEIYRCVTKPKLIIEHSPREKGRLRCCASDTVLLIIQTFEPYYILIKTDLLIQVCFQNADDKVGIATIDAIMATVAPPQEWMQVSSNAQEKLTCSCDVWGIEFSFPTHYNYALADSFYPKNKKKKFSFEFIGGLFWE